MQIRSKFVASLIPLLAAFGCGDDDGGGNDGLGGVSADEKLVDLSEAEARDVCNAMQTKFGRIAKASQKIDCVAFGIVSGDADSCEAGYEECLAEPPAAEFDLECAAPGGDQEGLGDGCDITVGELNGCVDALLARMEAGASKIDCGSSEDDLNNALAGDPPTACTQIGNRCDVFSGLGE